MKYYVDSAGAYLGGWDDEPPEGAVEVSEAPAQASQTWDFDAEEWSEVRPVLPDLAPWQFRAVLHLSGRQADLQAFIDSLPEPQKTIAQAKLEYTLVFERNNDLVLTAQQALGLSDAELNTLWNQALTL